MAYTRKTWSNGQTVDATEMNRIEDGVEVVDLTRVQGLQDALGSKVETDINGRVSMEIMPRGTSFEVRWVAPDWRYQNVVTAVRPAGLAHLYMHAYGGTVKPSFAIAGDLWFPEVI